MVLGKLPVPGRPTIWMLVGQGPTMLAVGAVGVVWTFLLSSIFSLLSPSLWEAAQYRLKYCLKVSLSVRILLCSFSFKLLHGPWFGALLLLYYRIDFSSSIF